MIIKNLWDREEIKINGVWSVTEVIGIKCPICGRHCNSTVTYPHFTEYVHGPTDWCVLNWVDERTRYPFSTV